jgi:hypothetical protein
MIHNEPISLFRLMKAGYAQTMSLLVIASFLIASVFPYLALTARAQSEEEQQGQEEVTTPDEALSDEQSDSQTGDTEEAAQNDSLQDEEEGNDIDQESSDDEGILGDFIQALLPSDDDDDDDTGRDQVTLCHFDDETDTYDQISVSVESVINGAGHSGHENDIIPTFEGFAGLNTDASSTAIFDNGCVDPSIEGHIIIDKVTIPAGDPTSFSFDASGGSYSDFSLTASGTPNDQELLDGNYSIAEASTTGWTQTSVICESSLGVSEIETPGSIELDSGETVTCTFTNTKNASNDDDDDHEEECRIEVVSRAGDEGVGNGDAVLAWIHSGWTTALNTVASWIWDTEFVQDPTIDEEKTFTKDFYVDTEVNDAVVHLAADNRYSVSINGTEVAADNGEFNYGSVTDVVLATSTIDQGWNTIEISIENIGIPGEDDPQVNPAGGIYHLVINEEANEDCDVIPPPGDDDDDDDASVTIIKQVAGTTTSATFDFDAGWLDQDIDFSLAAGASTTYTGLATGTYAISEILGTTTPWSLQSVICTDNNASTTNTVSTTTPGVNATVTLGADEDVVCTFTNGLATTTPPTGTSSALTIIKDVVGTTTATTTLFDFDAGWLDQDIDFSLADGASTTFSGLATGTYTISEVLGAQWNLQDVDCTDLSATSTVNDDLVITLDPGEHATCTFVNSLATTTPPTATSTGTLIVTKTVINDSGTGSATTSDFVLSVNVLGTTTATTTVTSGVAGIFATGTYAVSESGPGGYTATFGGDCNAQGQVTVALGATSTCTIVNDDLVRLPNTTSISGTKWNDLNNDGDRDLGEPGVAGVTISISDDATTTPFATTTVTDSNGDYSFFNLDEDTYFICETVQSGWSQTYPATSSAPFTDCQGSFGHEASTSLAGTSTTDISDLDFGNFQANQCTIGIVSDTGTTVNEQGDSNADLVTFIHPAWTASIAGASWIWGDDPVADPAATTTYTFTRTFEWNGPVTGAVLDIAADNTYTVSLNGTEVGSSTDGNNFALETQDSYDVSSLLVTGENTLVITVTNLPLEGATDPESNPAGVMFRLSATGSDPECDEAPSGGGGGGGGGSSDDDDDGRVLGSSSRRRSNGGGGGSNNDNNGEVLGATFPNDGSVLGSFFPGFPNTGEGGGTTQTLGYLLMAIMAAIVAGASFKLFRRS